MRKTLVVACTLLAALLAGLAVPRLGFTLTGALLIAGGAAIVLVWPQRWGDWWYWYDRYLDSGRWVTLSWQVKERDNWTCLRCREDGEHHMQAHHLRYQRWWFYALRLPEPRRNLVTLCSDCHEKEHGR